MKFKMLSAIGDCVITTTTGSATVIRNVAQAAATFSSALNDEAERFVNSAKVDLERSKQRLEADMADARLESELRKRENHAERQQSWVMVEHKLEDLRKDPAYIKVLRTQQALGLPLDAEDLRILKEAASAEKAASASTKRGAKTSATMGGRGQEIHD